MSNAWYHYVVPLAGSAVFVFAGIVLLCLSWFGGRTPDGKRRFGLVRALVGALFGLGVGGTIGIHHLLNAPTPWKAEELFNHVLRTPPEQIERFIILAGREDWHPLTTTEIVIDDPARIQQIAELLKTAPEASANHPRSRWYAVVKMVTHDGTNYFMVQATVPGDSNGTLVMPCKDEQGLTYSGNVRANGLEKILEDAVHTARTPE